MSVDGNIIITLDLIRLFKVFNFTRGQNNLKFLFDAWKGGHPSCCFVVIALEKRQMKSILSAPSPFNPCFRNEYHDWLKCLCIYVHSCDVHI